MTFVRESWKAILGFLSVFVGQLVENLVTTQGTVLLPQTSAEWITLFGTSFGGAVAVYLVGNRRNERQVAGDLAKLPEEAAQRVAATVPQTGTT